MAKNDALIQSQASTLENLENQMVALQSGKIVEPSEVVVEDEPTEKEESQPTVEVPTPKKLDAEKSDEQLHINISLADALEQMSNYVKFIKDILSKKKKLSEYEIVALMKECSAFLQNKLPLKLKDLESFMIPYNIRESYCNKALYVLGASINLMAKSIFKLLGIGEVKPITVTLQLADRSLPYPKGKIEDV
ncbi:uncharacterized protein LOC108458856 [Gossypium arboreum]|uniref:uncharacterized protein LOC108458856 n=1 Tax=Gossypium arboreum TaxID=29729 RepID=UPI00081935F9|nr:uncharacterized protein LOC108458856 [Gossypium arboreum]